MVLLSALTAIILTLPFAFASFLASGESGAPPAWARWVPHVFSLTFAPAPQVYATYGRLYLLLMLPEVWGLYVLSRMRHGGTGPLETWGFRIAWVGIWFTMVGIFTDYWLGIPPSILGEVVGSIVLGVGFGLLGLNFWRSGGLPRWGSLAMMGAGVGLVPVVLMLPHAPSGFLLLFHVAWVVLGYLFWAGKVMTPGLGDWQHRTKRSGKAAE